MMNEEELSALDAMNRLGGIRHCPRTMQPCFVSCRPSSHAKASDCRVVHLKLGWQSVRERQGTTLALQYELAGSSKVDREPVVPQATLRKLVIPLRERGSRWIHPWVLDSIERACHEVMARPAWLRMMGALPAPQDDC